MLVMRPRLSGSLSLLLGTLLIQIFNIKHNNNQCAALLLRCPLHQLHLQKILGFRPPLELLHERNLIYAPANALHNSNHTRNRTERDGFTMEEIDPRHQHNQAPTTSAICWRVCDEDPDCIAYVHLLDTDECYGYSYMERSERFQHIDGNLPLVADAEAIFYEKICLKVPETCRNRLWTLTKIPGTSLMNQGVKTISTLVTRRECAERCLFESEFNCLSASFAPSHRNNRERFNNNQLLAEPQPPLAQRAALGRCILSDKDKMIQPDAFRAAPYESEYIENQCYERKASTDNDHCSYELYANSSFIYAEAHYVGLTQKECQAYCTLESRFFCQGVSYHYDRNRGTSQCSLHSEDLISMGPRSLQLTEHSTYMRRVKCLDVQVLCTRDDMIIKYTPKDWFRGKMYASLHSRDCMTEGNGTDTTILRLAIGTEIKENRCGILRAYEVTHEYQRIFISALVVIQNNQNVQTQGDRLIKVGCIMSNATSYAASEGDEEHELNEEIPNAIALESSLEFSPNMPPSEGSLHFNTSDSGPLPKISLHIVDISHQHDTNDVQIGQHLELQISAEYSYDSITYYRQDLPPLPDFRATSLVAKTQDNQNYVLLIDENGCPTDLAVFPALERVTTSTRNMLRARFHAFKFAGTALVNFDVKIHFCGSKPCSVNNCQQRIPSNRRRRQAVANTSNSMRFPVKVQNPVYISTVLDLSNMSVDSPLPHAMVADQTFQNDSTVPLNFNLHVRGPNMAGGNSFIYGERGILLIAGIDDQLHLDSVCLNQSLLIAIFIFWLIFQIAMLFTCGYLIQKYKRLALLYEERRKLYEGFDYLEGRRVHWADQGGYTL